MVPHVIKAIIGRGKVSMAIFYDTIAPTHCRRTKRTFCATASAATADTAPFAFCAALACFLAFFSAFFRDCAAAQSVIRRVIPRCRGRYCG